MVFSSSVFILYFLPVFLVCYFATPIKWRNYTALAASLFFYAWGAPSFVFVLLLSALFDYHIALNIVKKNTIETNRFLLLLSVLANTGLLFYFKYFNFFIDNIIPAKFTSLSFEEVLLPIGISFFTFQKISYIVDVYREVKAPLRKYSDYLLFVILFPQLIAGPIVRFKDIADEIIDREKNERNIDNKILGFFRFTIGLSKKVFLANAFGRIADQYLANDSLHLTTTESWVAILAYTFQIYFDFSGYSDMAIGLGRMMGFNFPENFNAPYISKSITEFWQRWHMTLGSWMRDYLYIPLGGNKVSKNRLYVNLITVFLISGIWHGAAWNFLIWGAYHGVLLILEKLFLLRLYKRYNVFKPLSIVITFLLTVVGWVFFKISDWVTTREFLKNLFSFKFQSIELDNYDVFILIIGFLLSFLPLNNYLFKQWNRFSTTLNSSLKVVLIMALSIVALYGSISSITSSNFNPFIYFQF